MDEKKSERVVRGERALAMMMVAFVSVLISGEGYVCL